VLVKLLVVGLGGFVGAIARYGISGWVQRGVTWPAGTFVVNVAGCLAIGVLLALVEDRQALGPQTRLFLMTGLLGSLTTFSTFGYETFEYLKTSDFRLALGNVAANVIVGVGAVAVGRIAGRALGG
jgi:CrcB protein